MSQVRSGMFWVAVCRYSTRAISMIALLGLAKLLDSKEFGIMAGALIVLDVLALFQDFGISKELVYRRENVEQAAHTSFSLVMSFSVILFIICVAVAPLVGPILQVDGLTPSILIWSSTILIFSAFGSVPAALMQKEHRFKELVVPTTLSAVAASVGSLVLAWAGFGVYSLVAREIFAAATEAALLVYLSGYKPKLRFDRTIAREILQYAKPLLVANCIAVATKQFSPAAIARMLGAKILGGYAFANRVATMPLQEGATVMNRVLLPTITQRQADPAAVRSLVEKSTKLLLVVGLPLAMGIAWFSPPFLQLLYGEKWDHAIPFFQVLPFCALFLTVASPYGEACKGLGHTRIVMEYYFVHAVSLFALVTVGGKVWHSYGIALGMTLSALISLAWVVRRTGRLVGMASGDLIRSWTPIVAAGVAAGVGTLVHRRLLHVDSVWLGLSLQAVIMTGVFMAILLIVEREFIISLRLGALLRSKSNL